MVMVLLGAVGLAASPAQAAAPATLAEITPLWRASDHAAQLARLDLGPLSPRQVPPPPLGPLPATRDFGPFQVPYELTQRPELGTPADPAAMPVVWDYVAAMVRGAERRVFRRDGLDRETGCLALAIYFEARGESRLGQIAVSQVILNRVTSRKYPASICAVVYQNVERFNGCQFSFVCDRRADTPRDQLAWLRARELARKINCGAACSYRAHEIPPLLQLSAEMQRSTHYHATYVAPRWASKLHRSGQIGQHIFYISARVWS